MVSLLSSLNIATNALSVNEQAAACIGCGACMRKCPQHINIISQLNSIKELVNKLG